MRNKQFKLKANFRERKNEVCSRIKTKKYVKKNSNLCKYVQVKDVSKVSKLEKKISRSLSPEISMLRRS